jgi:hypothetical protein
MANDSDYDYTAWSFPPGLLSNFFDLQIHTQLSSLEELVDVHCHISHSSFRPLLETYLDKAKEQVVNCCL